MKDKFKEAFMDCAERFAQLVALSRRNDCDDMSICCTDEISQLEVDRSVVLLARNEIRFADEIVSACDASSMCAGANTLTFAPSILIPALPSIQIP